MTVSEQVQRVLAGEHISLAELESMVQRSALTRERGFNRRFLDWLFVIKDDTVERMANFELVRVGKGWREWQHPCRFCNGRGCKNCGWNGTILTLWGEKVEKRRLTNL